MKRIAIFGVSGVGGELTRRILQQFPGSKVDLFVRSSAKAKELLPAFHDRISFTEFDATKPDTLENACKALSGDGLDGMVYAIGSIPLRPLRLTTAEHFQEAFQVNTVSITEVLQRPLCAQPKYKCV
jgi:nucleoside-diphosphate-sugar epimerase